MVNKKSIEICASCVHDEPGFVSIIGTIPHCCKDHWTCMPGKDAKLYRPKESAEPFCPKDGGYCDRAYTTACYNCDGTTEEQM